MMWAQPIKSVAIIGAGAAGAASAAACKAEGVFDVICVFERRETPGGTWIYDHDTTMSEIHLHPGKLPPEVDPPLKIPKALPRTITPSSQYRYESTPIYAEFTTNVPAIAMSFSDEPFPYGPFVPHWIPRQYIETYFAQHRTDSHLVLKTTVEDVTRVFAGHNGQHEGWRLALRRFDSTRQVDIWWEEEFDALILANGHYSVPFVPPVQGLEAYIKEFPRRVSHSKSYRTADLWKDKRVVVIGNSASGHDITTLLVNSGQPKFPVYQSRRLQSRWDGDKPPDRIEWKPMIREYKLTGEIIFEDGTVLADIDAVIYCTGYKPSYPFWNERKNGGPLFDYTTDQLVKNYQHTFSSTFPRSLGIVGFPRVLTFRSFEYQAIALARLFSGRNAKPLPSLSEQKQWEQDRVKLVQKERRKFHDILWDRGETLEWLRYLFDIAGLPVLEGWGRYPPILGKETRWAIEHVRKYPEPGKVEEEESEDDWVVIDLPRHKKDSLHFV